MMCMRGRWLAWCLVVGASSTAEEWIVVGPRATGMGGAGVAITRGPLASYWNPANFAMRQPFRDPARFRVGLSVPAAAAASVHGDVIADLDHMYDALKDIDWSSVNDVFDSGESFNDPAHQQELQTLLRVVTEDLPRLDAHGDGVAANASGEVSLEFGRVGIAARGLGWSSVVPHPDLSADGLAFGDGLDDMFATTGHSPSSSAGTSLADRLDNTHPAGMVNELVYWAEQAGVNLSDTTVETMLDRILTGTTAGGTIDDFIAENDSGFTVRGLAVGEAGLSYAHPFFEGRLALGATVKALYGVTTTQHFRLQQLEDGSDILTELKSRKNRDESLRFGLDVGATVMPWDFLAVGITGRNINQPSFPAAGKDYHLDPQVRGGVALFPLDWITLAADLDLYKNDSAVLPGYESQVLGIGAEFSVVDILFLRAGLSKNLAESEGLTYHAGLGIHGGPVHLDIAGAASADRATVEYGDSSSKIPERAAASLMLELVIDF